MLKQGIQIFTGIPACIEQCALANLPPTGAKLINREIIGFLCMTDRNETERQNERNERDGKRDWQRDLKRDRDSEKERENPK